MDISALLAPLAAIQIGAVTLDETWYAGWGTLALVNAGLAQGKNRSGFAWFLGSVFLGPIATFLLVAFCDKIPDEE